MESLKLCRNGLHEMTPKNSKKTGTGVRCLACCKLRKKESYARLHQRDRHKPTHCKRGHERIPENLDDAGRCKLCKAERQRDTNKANPERHRETCNTWNAKNREKVRERSREQNKRLVDNYVAKSMRMSVKDAPPEIIEVARLNITLKREIKSWKSKPSTI